MSRADLPAVFHTRSQRERDCCHRIIFELLVAFTIGKLGSDSFTIADPTLHSLF